MMTIFKYVFQHKYYKKVMAQYDEVVTKFTRALETWSEYNSFTLNDSFETKEFIVSHISEIKEVASWIKKYDAIKSSQREGIQWFFNERGLSSIPTIGFLELKLISEQCHHIKQLQSYADTYNNLIRTSQKAVDRYIGVSKSNHSYDEKRRINVNQREIQNIASILKVSHTCQEKYPLAWKTFSRNRKFDDISIIELKKICEDDFSSKELFLHSFIKEGELIKLIMGTRLLPIDSFEKKAIEQEEEICAILASGAVDSFKVFNATIVLGETDEHKRAIMDSLTYGFKCNFSKTFEISNFYNLRNQYDEKGVDFDEAVCKTKDNDNAIRAYSRSIGGDGIVYIEDYLKVMTEGSDLYKFVEQYKHQKQQRSEAKRMQQVYKKGFEAIFGVKDLDSCTFFEVLSILSNEQSIKSKDSEIENQERIQRELERKRKEEERRKQELRDLQTCTSSWTAPTYSTIRCFSLFYYYPTTCPWDASEEEWDVRNLIWDFKANPNRPQSELEIKTRHTNALNKILPDLKRVINQYFGSNKNKLTLVCIPSSKRIVTERRYKDLAQQLCSSTGMDNGYDFVGLDSEGDARHLGGTNQAKFYVDSNYFKGRYVILFDDVITSGKSMERFKRLLESAGANVIGGLSIGKTKHERKFGNPIDSI